MSSELGMEASKQAKSTQSIGERGCWEYQRKNAQAIVCIQKKEKKYRKNKNKHNGGFLSNWDKQADLTQGHGSASVMSDNTTIAFIVHFTCVYFVCMHICVLCVYLVPV